jgi:hypothetical protein
MHNMPVTISLSLLKLHLIWLHHLEKHISRLNDIDIYYVTFRGFWPKFDFEMKVKVKH